jgi:AhpD family alkylhydroperoxidase
MTRIPVNTSIPEELHELLDAASNARRPPLNLHTQMAASPAVLAAYVGIRRALEEHGTLDRRTRIALMLAVSSTDRCEYTQAVNTMLATRAGFDESQIKAIVTGRATGEKPLDALIDVAREAAVDDGRVSGLTWQAAIDARCSDQQLAEAYASIALAVYVDQFVNYADTPFDVPAATQVA